MNRKLLIAGIVLLVGIGGWLMHYFSDREVIKRRFTAVAAEICKAGEETPVVIALKMKPVKEFLAPSCEVAVPERDYRETLEPGMIIRYLIMYRARQAALQVTIDGIDVDIPAKGQALVRTLVHVVANQGEPDFFDEIHPVEFALRKQEKTWLVSKATLPDALVRSR